MESNATEKPEVAILRGAGRVAAAVKATLGPLDRKAVVNRKEAGPLITGDTKEIAHQVELRDPRENVGARMMRAVVDRMDAEAHGARATAAVLAHAMLREGAEKFPSSVHPAAMVRGIKDAVRLVAAALDRLARPVSDGMLPHVAAMCADGDAAIGALVADAIRKAGKDGVIVVEESKTTSADVETVPGMRFDSGYPRPTS